MPTSTPWLRRPHALLPILLAFPLVTIPLTGLMLGGSSPGTQNLVVGLYLAIFGVTHFLLTFALYAQSKTLHYFRSSLRNRVIFFAIPAAIFVGIALSAEEDPSVRPGLVAIGFAALVRVFNYFHVNRQTYGVLQLLKSSWGIRLDDRVRQIENLFLLALTALMFCTYLHGGRPITTQIDFQVLALITVALGAPLVGYYARALRKDFRATLPVVLYLVFQTVSASLAVVWAPLYVASLAMHYVEYHVLMVPRCFHVSLDEAHVSDRWFGALRRNRLVFYAALVVLALCVQYRDVLTAGTSPSVPHLSWFLRHAPDGLFVFHYFIEMFVWRFRVPEIRENLAPLYFPAR